MRCSAELGDCELVVCSTTHAGTDKYLEAQMNRHEDAEFGQASSVGK